MKAIWVCPSLCGCKIEMDGEFDHASLFYDAGTLSTYKHPKPYTATSLNILSVCLAHIPLKTAPIDEAQFFDFNDDLGELVQNRGYMKLPLVNATEAEILYVNLYRYTAQMWSPSSICGCKLWQSWDRNDPTGNSMIIQKSHFTVRCRHHKNDTDDAVAVREECESVSKAISLLITTFLKLDGRQDEIKWRFEPDRSIVLSHSLLTQADKDLANALPKPDIKKPVRIE